VCGSAALASHTAKAGTRLLINTSPEPVTNRELTRALGRVLHRPTVLPLPGFAARAILGEMAVELLLSSVRAEPRRLLEAGYAFQDRELEPTLGRLLTE
jgi:hypothetical protein